MKLRIVYAVRALTFDATCSWLEDTCAGGNWTDSVSAAKTWPTRDELLVELAATEVIHPDYYADNLEIVELVEVSR